jgi:hypothetical protein
MATEASYVCYLPMTGDIPTVCLAQWRPVSLQQGSLGPRSSTGPRAAAQVVCGSTSCGGAEPSFPFLLPHV